MNFPRAYNQMTRSEQKELPLAEGTSVSTINQIELANWLQLPLTKDFLQFLQEEKEKHLNLAVASSCGMRPEREVHKELAKAKEVVTIINYASTRRKHDTGIED